jgi:hypothetical protein
MCGGAAQEDARGMTPLPASSRTTVRVLRSSVDDEVQRALIRAQVRRRKRRTPRVLTRI